MFQYTSAPWRLCPTNYATAFVEGPRGALIGATDTRAIGMTQAAVRGNNALLTAAPSLFAAFDQLLKGHSVDTVLVEVLRQANSEGAQEHAQWPWNVIQRSAYVVVCAGNGMPLLAGTLSSPRRVRKFVGSLVVAGGAPELYHAGIAYVSQPATKRRDSTAKIQRLMLRLAAQADELTNAVKIN